MPEYAEKLGEASSQGLMCPLGTQSDDPLGRMSQGTGQMYGGFRMVWKPILLAGISIKFNDLLYTAASATSFSLEGSNFTSGGDTPPQSRQNSLWTLAIYTGFESLATRIRAKSGQKWAKRRHAFNGVQLPVLAIYTGSNRVMGDSGVCCSN